MDENGEVTGKTYYDERGLKLRDSYHDGSLSSRSYDDDNGMQASEQYNSKGELVSKKYYYYDLDGNRQKYEVPLENPGEPDASDDPEDKNRKTRFEGDVQITEMYTPEGEMYARYTVAPAECGVGKQLVFYTYENGELVDCSVERFPEGGGSTTQISRTYLSGDEWIMETYDENGNVVATEVVARPEE